jgi:hypothetical protein
VNRKRSLSSHLSRREPDEEEFGDAIAEIFASSDRVAAIMCAALVEFELISAIKCRLEDASDMSALFHSGEGSPFGTFKQKIVAGKAMGIYGKDVASDLDIIRDIRNQFAHALLKIDFDNEHIAASCASLRDYIAWEETTERDVGANRIKFENTCLSIGVGLMRRTGDYYRERAEAALAKLGPLDRINLHDLVTASPKGADKDVIDEMLANKF